MSPVKLGIKDESGECICFVRLIAVFPRNTLIIRFDFWHSEPDEQRLGRVLNLYKIFINPNKDMDSWKAFMLDRANKYSAETRSCTTTRL